MTGRFMTAKLKGPSGGLFRFRVSRDGSIAVPVIVVSPSADQSSVIAARMDARELAALAETFADAAKRCRAQARAIAATPKAKAKAKAKRPGFFRRLTGRR